MTFSLVLSLIANRIVSLCPCCGNDLDWRLYTTTEEFENDAIYSNSADDESEVDDDGDEHSNGDDIPMPSGDLPSAYLWGETLVRSTHI
jgi:hypothetical protein